ncbi:SAM-dependent methyltransferase [Streptomyces sp. IB2014 016-6]|uniref:SAM-dependent methyltransferase n=1 Tax=Streptomyces sp. IB2014 016-6 TaxID=2517818 RepID=UPI0011C98A7E|nr:SAM-dependent methyltransferase [Streptomyces sp. IB2014 016-6]TXL87701.1 hypothetical protein EW053_22565 [Streptomyces sp. IB2014 016-6]
MSLADGFFQRHAVSRIDNYLTGDTENYEADRYLASLLVREAPWLPDMVKINRRHGSQAVTVLSRDLGIRQYLDLGCGLPTSWNKRLQRSDPASTYEAAVAAGTRADTRVVYVDNDPMVHAHARMMLDVCSSTTAVLADIGQIGELLNDPAVQALAHRPTAVLLHEVLPWVSDQLAEKAMTALRDWLPDGSAISVTHATTDRAPDAMRALVDHYANAGTHLPAPHPGPDPRTTRAVGQPPARDRPDLAVAGRKQSLPPSRREPRRLRGHRYTAAKQPPELGPPPGREDRSPPGTVFGSGGGGA